MGKPNTPVWLNDADLLRRDVVLRPPIRSGPKDRTSVRRLSVTQITKSVLPMLLHYEDRDSMAHSVEARVPFLDYRVVELALSLPDSLKIQAGMNKLTYRQAMKGIVPEPILRRTDKMGFVTPQEIWFRSTASLSFRNEVQNTARACPHIFHESSLMHHFDRVATGNVRHDPALWRIICFGRWLKRFRVTG